MLNENCFVSQNVIKTDIGKAVLHSLKVVFAISPAYSHALSARRALSAALYDSVVPIACANH